MYRRIPIRNRKGIVAYVLVDKDDFLRLNTYHWHFDKDGYAITNVIVNGKRTSESLHRMLMGLNKGDLRQVDHIFGNKLDCRKSQLRIVDGQKQQQQNKRKTWGKSKYRGVDFYVKYGKWRARVKVNYKSYLVGYFDTEDEAGKAAAKFREERMEYATN